MGLCLRSPEYGERNVFQAAGGFSLTCWPCHGAGYRLACGLGKAQSAGRDVSACGSQPSLSYASGLPGGGMG